MSDSSFIRALPSAEKEELVKLTTLQEIPKLRYATKVAITSYPQSRRGRKAVFSHIEVYKMVETVAGKMREAGVRPGTVCAFALPASTESLIYFYSLMWIAAIAAPIDPCLSDEDFAAAIDRSGAKVIVSPLEDDDSHQEIHDKSARVAQRNGLLHWQIHRTVNEGVVLEIGGRVMGSAAWTGGAGDFKLDPEEVAVHIATPTDYVALSHLSLCEAAKTFQPAYNLQVSMSTLLTHPLHDIQAILVLASTFYSGGHIVLPGLGGFNPEKFWDLAKTHNVSWLSATSAQVLDLHAKTTKSHPNGPPHTLEFIRTASSSSPIAGEVLDKVSSDLGTPIYESYGVPETCGLATANTAGNVRTGTAGTPVRGVRVAVFDIETGERLKNGSVGEIAVSGKNLGARFVGDDDDAGNAAVVFTEDEDGEETRWLATGDRGSIDEEGCLVVQGNSVEMRALEAERREAEAEAAAELALATAKAKEEDERREAERQAKEEAEEEARRAEEEVRFEEERRLEEERLAEEERIAEHERKLAEERRLQEEEEERRRKEEEEAAAAADAAAAAEEEEERQRAEEEERVLREAAEEKKREDAERSAVLLAAGVKNPDALDEETANAILARLQAIEENHRRLQQDVEGRNAAELAEMRRRVAEAEAEAEAVAEGGEIGANGKVVDVRMVELEAAVMAAAASAESSASNTREALKAAREVADAAYGANHSKPVEVKASTGDQGALTKTVRVPLDDVEKAIKEHPAVDKAKAFGRKDKRFGTEVFCAIVPKKGARVSEPWLKLHAQSMLPAQMVPKKFYYMSAIPDGMTRRELSESNLLQDLSEFSGYSEVKHVKGPQWKPKARRA